MNEKKLTKKQLTAFITSFLLSNTLTVSGNAKTQEKYGYITIFLSYVVFLFLIKIYDRIFEKSGCNNIYDVLKNTFSQRFYKAILFVILVFSFLSSLMSTLNIMFFVTVSAQGKINIVFFAILLCLCLYSVTVKKENVLGRYCSLAVFGIVFLFALMISFGIFKGNLKNLSLTLPISFSDFSKSTFYNFLSPFSDIFFVYLFLQNLSPYKETSKSAKISGLTATVILSGVYIVNLSVLGKNLMSNVYYPTLFSFGIINPFNKISRSEIVYYSSHIFFDIIYTAVGIFIAKTCFFKIFTKKSKTKEHIFSVSAVSLILLFILFSSFSGSFYNLYNKIAFLRLPINIGIVLLLFFKVKSQKITTNSFPKS